MQRHSSSSRIKFDDIPSIMNKNSQESLRNVKKNNNKSQFIGFNRFQRAKV